MRSTRPGFIADLDAEARGEFAEAWLASIHVGSPLSGKYFDELRFAN
jgi:hypothetical protein